MVKRAFKSRPFNVGTPWHSFSACRNDSTILGTRRLRLPKPSLCWMWLTPYSRDYWRHFIHASSFNHCKTPFKYYSGIVYLTGSGNTHVNHIRGSKFSSWLWLQTPASFCRSWDAAMGTQELSSCHPCGRRMEFLTPSFDLGPARPA